MLEIISAALNAALRRIQAARARRARRRAALAYNHLGVHSWALPLWMCPTCNSVHRGGAASKFTGVQFPACCEFEAGHRLDKCHATRYGQ